MISWKCDGCGRTVETEYKRVSDHYCYSLALRANIPEIFDFPAPPENWWVGKKYVYDKTRYQTIYHYALACSGACCDVAQKKLGALKWEWKTP